MGNLFFCQYPCNLSLFINQKKNTVGPNTRKKDCKDNVGSSTPKGGCNEFHLASKKHWIQLYTWPHCEAIPKGSIECWRPAVFSHLWANSFTPGFTAKPSFSKG